MQTRFKDFLFNLLSIYSPTGAEQPCADFLMETFQSYSPIQDSSGNIIITIPGIGDPILWTAHMDVVEPCQNLSPLEEDGYIKNKEEQVLGIDNKAAIACFYEAILRLKETSTSHRPIELIFTTEEETTGKGVLGIDTKTISSKVGISIDSAAPLGTIIYTSPYCYDLNWEIIGKTGHVKTFSTDTQYAWQALQEIISTSPFGNTSKNTTINWSTISGGHGRNTITESFTLKGEMRSFDKKEADKLLINQELLLKDLQKSYAQLEISSEHILINPGYTIRIDDAWINTLTSTFTKLGVSSELVKTYGVADANTWQERGINIINLGSGAEFTHTKDERISVQDLETTISFLMEIAKV